MSARFTGIVAYALLVFEDIPSINREANVGGKIEDWKGTIDDMDPLHKNSTWSRQIFRKKRLLDANGCLLRKMIFFSKSQIQS